MAGWTTDRQGSALTMPDRGAAEAFDGGLAIARRSEPAALSALIARSAGELLQRRSAGGVSPVPTPSLDLAPSDVVEPPLKDEQLLRIVELEIIPRLMLLHGRPATEAELASLRLDLTAEHVETLAQLSVEAEAGVVSSYVQALADAGAPLEKVFLDLLAPAARLLGEAWNEDRYDFSQVTIGLWRLQQVLHEQGRRFAAPHPADADGRIALMAAVPGSQHTFGAAMAAEFFTRAGWDVDFEPHAGWDQLSAALAGRWIDMVGLSVSTVESIPAVASAVAGLRQASVNPRLLVMVGGPLALGCDDLTRRCGADLQVSCAQTAVDAANAWLDRQRLLA